MMRTIGDGLATGNVFCILGLDEILANERMNEYLGTGDLERCGKACWDKQYLRSHWMKWVLFLSKYTESPE